MRLTVELGGDSRVFWVRQKVDHGNSDLLRLGRAGRSGGVRKESVAHDPPKRSDAVFPGDFLSLCICPPIVRDRRLVHGPAPPSNFDGYFLLEAKLILFQVKG